MPFKKMIPKQIPAFILRMGFTASATMLTVFIFAKYFDQYIKTLTGQVFAYGLIQLMPEYALLCLTIGVIGFILTDIYYKQQNTR